MFSYSGRKVGRFSKNEKLFLASHIIAATLTVHHLEMRRNDNYNISFYFQSKFFIWKQDWKFSSSLNKITWYLSKSELPTIILMYDKNKAGSPQVENRCVFNEFFLFRNPSFDSVGPSKLCDPVTTSYWWTVGLAGVALLN